ncbi:hypothetical protein T211_12100 [Lactococcus lactis subsp. lactis bv. diacetylactis str. LD61]|nr:hypothetical protein T211_12100 [Lactococcus lactis subsp. lactis bv. diacetylactis str. LD61]
MFIWILNLIAVLIYKKGSVAKFENKTRPL